MTIEQFIASLSKERCEQLQEYLQEAIFDFNCSHDEEDDDYLQLMRLVNEQLNK